MQIYFSQSLPAGSTSDSFIPHSYGSDSHRTNDYVLLVNRPDASDGTTLVVQQLQNDGATQLQLLTDVFQGGIAYSSFQPDPNQGAISIVNNGPGDCGTVSVMDELPR